MWITHKDTIAHIKDAWSQPRKGLNKSNTKSNGTISSPAWSYRCAYAISLLVIVLRIIKIQLPEDEQGQQNVNETETVSAALAGLSANVFAKQNSTAIQSEVATIRGLVNDLITRPMSGDHVYVQDFIQAATLYDDTFSVTIVPRGTFSLRGRDQEDPTKAMYNMSKQLFLKGPTTYLN
jgi:hypothetical protein